MNDLWCSVSMSLPVPVWSEVSLSASLSLLELLVPSFDSLSTSSFDVPLRNYSLTHSPLFDLLVLLRATDFLAATELVVVLVPAPRSSGVIRLPGVIFLPHGWLAVVFDGAQCFCKMSITLSLKYVLVPAPSWLAVGKCFRTSSRFTGCMPVPLNPAMRFSAFRLLWSCNNSPGKWFFGNVPLMRVSLRHDSRMLRHLIFAGRNTEMSRGCSR